MSESNRSAEYTPRVYFPNLNGLRFIAAFLVIIHHVEQIKSEYGLANHWRSRFVQIIGEQGVVLFFVLSGFLITYLLLEEEKQTGTIKVRDFYIRRILRIWPLYFFIAFLALAVLPQIPMFILPGYELDFIYRNLQGKIILFLLFLPNLMPYVTGFVPYASQTWSIGTEEQFYLMWPLLMKNIKRHRITLMMTIILGYIIVARALWSSHTDFLPFKYAINGFWSLFNIDCMAIGGFLAILLHTQSRYLKIVRNNLIFFASLLLVSYMLSQGITIQHLYKETYAVLFGIIILNFAANPAIPFHLEFGVLKYLGKISYGLYMYHPIGIVLGVNLAMLMGLTNNLVIYPLSVGFAVLIASLSYTYFESFFLKFKLNFSSIRSGDDLPAPEANINFNKAVLKE